MKNNAVVLVLVAVITCQQAVLSTEEIGTEVGHEILQECIKKSGVSDAESKLIMTDEMDDIDEKDFGPKMKCFLLCLYERLDLIDANGKLRPDKVLNYMMARFEEHKDQVKPAMAKCASVTDSNPCEMVFKLEMCMEENIDEEDT